MVQSIWLLESYFLLYQVYTRPAKICLSFAKIILVLPHSCGGSCSFTTMPVFLPEIVHQRPKKWHGKRYDAAQQLEASVFQQGPAELTGFKKNTTNTAADLA